MMGKKIIKTMCVLLLMLGAGGLAHAEEVVFVVNNYAHSTPFQPPDSTVMMLRGSDLEILETLILWGLIDAHSAALTRDRRHLWVTCPNAQKIAVIDVRSFEVVKTIGFGEYPMEPMGIAFTPDGRYAYVTLVSHSYLIKIDARTYDFAVHPSL